MMSSVKAYKIFSVGEKGELFSIAGLHKTELSPQLRDCFVLQYHPNQITKPIVQGSKIFVFESQEVSGIGRLRDTGYHSQLWECEVDCLEQPNRRILDPFDCNKTAEEFWQIIASANLDALSERNWLLETNAVPVGTRWCNQLMPIRCLETVGG